MKRVINIDGNCTIKVTNPLVQIPDNITPDVTINGTLQVIKQIDEDIDLHQIFSYLFLDKVTIHLTVDGDITLNITEECTEISIKGNCTIEL